LQFGRRTSKGKTTSLVIFLHGYGADGADLLGLADPLAPHLPGTVFLAPDAPEPCVGTPFGRQWFPVPWLDGSSEAASAASLALSSRDLNGFIDAALAAEGVEAKATALIGFSQGTMMALHVALRRAEPLAAVVGFSGRLLYPETLGRDITARPPVLLVHGDADPVVPYADLAKAAAGLKAAGVSVQTHTSRGVGHGIAPDGLNLALQFLHQHLPSA
jgi:phospholipase/carboxylesterase